MLSDGATVKVFLGEKKKPWIGVELVAVYAANFRNDIHDFYRALQYVLNTR